MASLYYYGRGVTQDYEKTIEWLKPAAENDDVEAIFNVGATYEAMRNYTEAITWYERGLLQGNQDSFDALESLAEQRYAEAQYRLAVAYEGGVGPAPKDLNQAVKWYHQSAEAGYVIAQYHLGQLYYDGRFILQDYKEALRWCELAAKQGMRSAQHEVAQMYKEGTGVKQDYVKAHAWMNLAGSARERALIEQNLTTEQVIEAQALAKRLAQRYDMGIINP